MDSGNSLESKDKSPILINKLTITENERKKTTGIIVRRK